MADDELRPRVHEALTQEHYRRARERIEASPEEHCAAFADVVMAVVTEEALDHMAEKLLEETRLRSLDFRNGMAMDLEPARELAANFVGAARAMLGDAENYSETPVEMEFGLAGQRERFAFIVQRVGKITPHEARRAAEAERDAQIQRAETAEHEITRVEGFCRDQRNRAEQAEGLLTAASRHLRALCHAGRHDHMGANLSCVGCELARRIEASLHSPAAEREGCVDHMPNPRPDCEGCTR